MARLEGQVAIVTGAGSGIGRAGAQLFAREGARVAVAEIERTRGEAVAAGIRDAGGDAVYVPCDVRDSASVQAMVTATVERWGRLDVLYHNAIDVAFVKPPPFTVSKNAGLPAIALLGERLVRVSAGLIVKVNGAGEVWPDCTTVTAAVPGLAIKDAAIVVVN